MLSAKPAAYTPQTRQMGGGTDADQRVHGREWREAPRRKTEVTAALEITRSTVPGNGTLHHIVTRGGDRFAVLVDAAERRHLFVYDSPDADEPSERFALDPDEADELAGILQRRSVGDRLAALERRLAEIRT
ncbi:hypothetical protein ACN3XK_21570 [Actinomadura welshii]